MKYTVISKDTVELKFYGEISYWWISAQDYTTTLEEIERAGYTKLVIRIHSYGGHVFEGNAMWTANKRSKLHITGRVEGVAASMMAFLLLTFNRVEMSNVAKVMFHPPRSYKSGMAKDFFAEAKLLKSMEKDVKRELKNKTKLSQEEVEEVMDGVDNWYDAEECIEMGIAHAVFNGTEFTTDAKGKPDASTPIEKVFGQYTALGSDPIITKNTKTMDKKAIIEKFGLTSVTPESSDTAVMDALNAKMQTNQSRIDQLEQAQASSLTAQIDSAVAIREAELKVKFTDAQKATFKTVGEKSGLEVLKSVLAELKPTATLQEMLSSGTSSSNPTTTMSEDRKTWNWDQWEKNDPDGLQEMEKTNQEAFKKLYNAKWPGNEARFV